MQPRLVATKNRIDRMPLGIVCNWHELRGYGFIQPDGAIHGERDVYFSSKTASYSPVSTGDRVWYELRKEQLRPQGPAAFKVEKR
jgi:cold shock CspA family protein